MLGGQTREHRGPDAEDWQDVRALCRRFDLPVPAEYDRFRFLAHALPAVRGERAPMTPEVRRDPALAGPLRHEDFLEFGSSGRICSADRTTLRSSVWVAGADGRWRLRFHQGTVTDASG